MSTNATICIKNSMQIGICLDPRTAPMTIWMQMHHVDTVEIQMKKTWVGFSSVFGISSFNKVS